MDEYTNKIKLNLCSECQKASAEASFNFDTIIKETNKDEPDFVLKYIFNEKSYEEPYNLLTYPPPKVVSILKIFENIKSEWGIDDKATSETERVK